MAVSLSTPDKLEYTFYPVARKILQFRVKAAKDAHVALTTGPFETERMFEIFIGGWENSKSVIRRNREKPDVVEVPTPEILSDDEFRGFWVRWDDNTITVGRENVSEPFLLYTDPDLLEVTHFGVCTGWGATGEWLLEVEGITPSAPSASLVSAGSESWVESSGGVIPPGAVEGGKDGDEALYVGRAEHEGAILPGKVKPSHSVCYVAWGGEEHGKENYEVLVASNVSWVPISGGEIPPNAIPGGKTETDEQLFVGRVQHDDTITVGKVQPSHGVLYIPFGGAEVSFPDYEILVSN